MSGMTQAELNGLDGVWEDQDTVIKQQQNRIAELEEEISTALDLLPIINDAQYLFYNKHRHLLRD